MVRDGIVLGERYEVLSKIGAGGMADVYKGRDTMLNRYVAIKVLKKEYREDETFVKKFRSEAQAAAGLMHPNIVNVYDVGEDRGLYYMVMELVEGITLKGYIDKKGALSAREVISIAIQICAGIDSAHRNHIIHRDIKPQNIIISKDGKVKVTDFGIARATTSNTVSSNVMGSVHYTSPEQARGGISDAKSDIYSVGITLYEMITGELPFDGESTVAIAIKHLQEDIMPPSEHVEDIPYSLEQIILKCTMKNAEKRYSSIPELVRDLKRSLVDPEGDFVNVNLYPGGRGTTVMINRDELSAIQDQYDHEYDDDEYDDDYDRRYDDDEYDDDEDERTAARGRKDQNVNKRMSKVMKIMSVVVGVIVLFAVIFVGGQAAGIFKSLGKGVSVNEENKVEVPNLIGKREEDAREEVLKGKNLKWQVVQRKTSKEYEEGIVIEQETQAGKKVAKDTMIRVVVSAGLEGVEITIPDVSGMDEDGARKALINAGFDSGMISATYDYDENVESGYAIETTPKANSKATKDAKITIKVSKGAKKPDKIQVPDVTGKTEDEARNAIKAVGLSVGNVNYEPSDSIPEGYVISQEPSGSKLDPGSSVSLLVSEGSGQIQVPDVAGQSVGAAEAALSKVGLGVKRVYVEDTASKGTVVGSNPKAWSEVPKGSKVEIYISNGPSPSNNQDPGNNQNPEDGSAVETDQ